MIRQDIVNAQEEHRTGTGQAGFRWRGRDVSRLENLSDIIFAFAITLLVVAPSVPQTYEELTGIMRGFIAFALAFALLLAIWIQHYVFFRRYGLNDGPTVFLNACLLFLILFFAYPLKFLAEFLVDLTEVFLVEVILGQEATIAWKVDTVAQGAEITAIFSAGYVSVFGLFVLMYRHALKKADALDLSPREREMTRKSIAASLFNALIAAVAILLVLTLPARLAVFSGFTYWLIWPGETLLERIFARRIARLPEEAQAPAPTSP